MSKSKLFLWVAFMYMLFLNHAFLQAQSLRKLLEEEKTLVFAHRGAVNPDIPENSLLGLQQALNEGIDMLEIDIMESQDGVLYLLHDRTLDRTTLGTGNIAEWKSKDLDRVGLKETEEYLPRFENFLKEASQQELYLMLDVKNAPLHKVMEAVEVAGMLDRIVLLTFSLARAQEAFDLSQRFLVSVLINEEEEFDEYLCKTTDPYHLAVYVNKDANLSLYIQAQELGLPVITDVMGAIDKRGIEDPFIYKEFVQKRNPNVVVSDYPIILKQVIN
ncbi:glycerophosphodiester phosphodiesterase family protein [Cecembia lonarensis]|uniref:Cytoplasmic glycerophosphodiester phosphodiesterase n=1 Tax=Cecembia lonarensis (strain CCUG 58316 / KCTC 22772 / LW9) TaxID=1225176 RepID=K1L8Y4_CECL9|nr:glycerophosphodiester phosphodiesterase family protein [Cecembia lonarensis]EKB48632.1 cytoplasmic glycerophosphodiester phosphodiesterase [Cecembia lonarensis LW9]